MTNQPKPKRTGEAPVIYTISNQPGVLGYQRLTYTLLGIQTGHQLLDVGCGAGKDVLALVKLVGNNAQPRDLPRK